MNKFRLSEEEIESHFKGLKLLPVYSFMLRLQGSPIGVREFQKPFWSSINLEEDLFIRLNREDF